MDARLLRGSEADMFKLPSVLIVDDHPDHLMIYGRIFQRAGLRPVPCLARESKIEVPKVEEVALVVMDYSLDSETQPTAIAEEVRREYPLTPFLLLCDMTNPPEEMEPFVEAVVCKGNPERLIETAMQMAAVPSGTS